MTNTNQKIAPFLFEGEDTVRVIIGIKNPTQAVAPLDEDERSMFNIGRQGDAMKAGTTAHRFRKWITSEVLPSIRRTGAYVPDAAPKLEPTFHAKAHDDWSEAELRVKLSEVGTYRQVMNTAAALRLMRREGFPMPPDHLLPAWQRQDGGLLGQVLTVNVGLGRA